MDTGEMIRYKEVDLLLNDLYLRYGYNFTEYSKASLLRRIQRLCALDKFPSFAEFRYRLQNERHIRRLALHPAGQKIHVMIPVIEAHILKGARAFTDAAIIEAESLDSP